MSITVLILAIIITVNSDLERVYNYLSNVFFGGRHLSPKETKFN